MHIYIYIYIHILYVHVTHIMYILLLLLLSIHIYIYIYIYDYTSNKLSCPKHVCLVLVQSVNRLCFRSDPISVDSISPQAN